MWILPARARPVFINAAMIVREEKRAWRRNYHVVAVLIDTKVFFDERGGPHAEMFCQALNIVLIKYRACSLATVGTLQAIGCREYLIVKLMNCCIEFARISLL